MADSPWIEWNQDKRCDHDGNEVKLKLVPQQHRHGLFLDNDFHHHGVLIEHRAQVILISK
jgi:hypothetical protein